MSPWQPPGYVQWLRCRGCARAFPTYVLEADLDYVTQGWIGLTSRAEDAVVLVKLTDDEFRLGLRDDARAGRLAAERVGAALGREDLVYPTLDHLEEPEKSGLSFQQYLARNRAPKPWYRCLHCEDLATDCEPPARRTAQVSVVPR